MAKIQTVTVFKLMKNQGIMDEDNNNQGQMDNLVEGVDAHSGVIDRNTQCGIKQGAIASSPTSCEVYVSYENKVILYFLYHGMGMIAWT